MVTKICNRFDLIPSAGIDTAKRDESDGEKRREERREIELRLSLFTWVIDSERKTAIAITSNERNSFLRIDQEKKCC